MFFFFLTETLTSTSYAIRKKSKEKVLGLIITLGAQGLGGDQSKLIQ